MNLTKQLTTKGKLDMTGTHNERLASIAGGDEVRRLVSSDMVGTAIQRLKNAVWFDFSERVGEHTRLLRLALNEAEALAWQTDFPHLVFPVLAREKAQAAVAWHQRQRLVRKAPGEVAFAE
jgi:hypothetical protein